MTYYTIVEQSYKFDSVVSFDSDVEKGIRFCEIEKVFLWLGYGSYICEVEIPKEASVITAEEKCYKATSLTYKSVKRINVLELIKMGAEITCPREIMDYAIKENDLESIKYISEYMNFEPEFMKISFFSACDAYFLPGVEYFVASGVDVDANEGAALIKATYFGRIKLIHLLLFLKASISIRDEAALHTAFQLRNHMMIKFLMNNGAKIENLFVRYAKSILRNQKITIGVGKILDFIDADFPHLNYQDIFEYYGADEFY